MKKTSGLVTWSGIVGAFGVGLVAVPLLTITAYANVIKDGPPKWFLPWIFPMMLIGFLLAAGSHAISGVASKGVDDIPTIPQVEAATIKAVADKTVSLTDAKPAEMPAVPVVIVHPSDPPKP